MITGTNDLSGVRQAGALLEGDEQGEVAALGRALGVHPIQGQRDRGGRGLPLVGDVAGDAYVLGQLHGLGHRVGDPHVGLVRHEQIQVLYRDPGAVQRLQSNLRHLVGRPAEHRGAVHGDVRQRRVLDGEGLDPVRAQLDGAVLLAVEIPDDRADPRDVGGTDDDGAGAVSEDERGAAQIEDEFPENLGSRENLNGTRGT